MTKTELASVAKINNILYFTIKDIGIVATTESSDGLPSPSEGFLNLYYKHPVKKVKLVMRDSSPVIKNGTVIIRPVDWVDRPPVKREKMYTESEVKKMLEIAFELFSHNSESNFLKQQIKKLFEDEKNLY